MVLGGYLNLNESFSKVFGSNLVNLNESVKIQNEKFFYTEEIKKLISFKDFKTICADASNQLQPDFSMVSDNIHDTYDIDEKVFNAIWKYATQEFQYD